MKYIGAHVSISGGVENAPQNAIDIGARAFALFTKNQRRWLSKPLTEESINLFRKTCLRGGFNSEHILPHDSYLINLGHPEEDGLKKSRNAFLDEMRRCEQLGLMYLNFHPGSHLNKIDPEKCLERIAESVNLALSHTENVIAVIENTAGQGTNMGNCFEDLAFIIDRVNDKSRTGICLDTCHAHAAGYDIRTAEAFNAALRELDNTAGLEYLKAVHINDAKKPLGSRVDRHESIGKGHIGLDSFKFIMNSPYFDNIPMVLETPDPSIWKDEIKLLYGLAEDKD